MAPVKLNWTVESMKSAQEEVIKTSTLEAWPTLNNKTSTVGENSIQHIRNINMRLALKYSYRLLTCSKSCIASWIATESDEMIKITPKDASGL